MSSDKDQVSRVLNTINDAWLQRRPQDLRDLLHGQMIMVYPGFAGREEGKAAVIAGFEDFSTNARALRFEESDRQVDVVGDAAVASFSFELTYEREGQTYRCIGRDLWVFQRWQGAWLAVWRTMLDVSEDLVDSN